MPAGISNGRTWLMTWEAKLATKDVLKLFALVLVVEPEPDPDVPNDPVVKLPLTSICETNEIACDVV